MPTVSALGAAAATAFGAAAVGRRQRSGRVQTSEASDLWRESSALRQELYQQVTALRGQLDDLREENIALQEALAAMRLAHVDCKKEIGELTARLEAFRAKEGTDE